MTTPRTSKRRPAVFDLDAVDMEEAIPEPDVQDAFDEPEPAPAGAERRAGGQARPSGRTRSTGGEAAATADEQSSVAAAPARKRRRWSFLSLFTAGVSGLAALALSLSLYAFIEDLFARVPWLGGVAALLAAMAVLGLVGMVLREWFAIRRLKEVEALRQRADAAVADDNRKAALAVLSELSDIYANRPATARGRKAMKAHMREIIDGRDLIGLGEREILSPLDREAIGAIVSSSRRVAAVTALSPRALVDLAFVLFSALSLVRRIATIYGGRPGTLGFIRVLRHAVAHLAVTGGMAAGDTLVGEVIGKGIAAKLSAKLGEGIVNGLMTARLGLATLDVLRPLPFTATRRPRVNDIIGEIAGIASPDKEQR